MDTNRLHYFCTVAETGSLRGAAELLRLSPAALSKSIKLLEQELSLELLVPSGRGILITDVGKLLSQQGRTLLNQLDLLEATLISGGEENKPLRIGSFEVFTTYFLGPLLGKYLVDVPVVVHEFVPGLLEEALEKREVDVGVTYIPIPSGHLDHLKVGTIEMGLFGIKEAFKDVPFDHLPFAIPTSPVTGSPNKVRGLDGWPDDQLKRWVKYQVTMMESALELCRQSMAVGYFPKFVIKLHNQRAKEQYRLSELSLPKKLSSGKQDVYIVKRKSDIEGKEIKRLAKAIRMVCLKP